MKSVFCPKSAAALFLPLTCLLIIGFSCLADTLTVTLESGNYTLALGDKGGDRIEAQGFGTMQIPGKPVLPSKIFYIAVPPDAEVVDVTFDYQMKPVEGSFNLEPGKLSLPARKITHEEYEAAQLEFDTNYDATYNSDDPYPAEPARFVGGGGLRKYQLVRIQFSPWQYLPQSGRLLHIPEVTANIEYKATGKIDPSIKLSDTIGEDRAMELLYNYAQAREWYPVQEKALGSTDYRYIIMCTEATEDAVEPLADWKRSIGYRVKIFTKEWLEANTAYPSYELERQIRYYLRDNYQDWNADYFLIVGDTDVIPMRACTAGDGGTWESWTDTYYGELSLMDGASWDDDWDGNYAERTEDSIDWAMELAVGRIPDNDPATVEAICEKIRAFEMDTGTWKKRSLHLAAIWKYTNEDDLGGIKSDNAYVIDEMFNDWSWTGWTRYTMYEQDGVDPSVFSSTWDLNDTNVCNVWDNGQYALVNMAGHGSSYGIYDRIWQWDDGDGIPEWPNGEMASTEFFDRDDISALNNNYPSIVFFSGCSCGKYDESNSLAKELLHTGAVATIASAGNVVYAAPWYDEGDGAISTFQYLWNKKHVYSGYYVGSALRFAKTDFAASYNWTDGAQQILLNMNLYGDPALRRAGHTIRPNLDYYWPAGWDFVVVPRDTNDGTSTWCPVSSTLPGNSDTTWINYSFENNGNVTAYQVYNHVFVDDVYAGMGSCPWIDPAQHIEHNNIFGTNVKGGRHTLKVVYDPNNECTESNESDKDSFININGSYRKEIETCYDYSCEDYTEQIEHKNEQVDCIKTGKVNVSGEIYEGNDAFCKLEGNEVCCYSNKEGGQYAATWRTDGSVDKECKNLITDEVELISSSNKRFIK